MRPVPEKILVRMAVSFSYFSGGTWGRLSTTAGAGGGPKEVGGGPGLVGSEPAPAAAAAASVARRACLPLPGVAAECCSTR